MPEVLGALSLALKATELSDCRGKQDIKVLSTKIGSRDRRLNGKLSKVFVVELLLLKSDHSASLLSSDGPRSSLPAMLFWKESRETKAECTGHWTFTGQAQDTGLRHGVSEKLPTNRNPVLPQTTLNQSINEIRKYDPSHKRIEGLKP